MSSIVRQPEGSKEWSVSAKRVKMENIGLQPHGHDNLAEGVIINTKPLIGTRSNFYKKREGQLESQKSLSWDWLSASLRQQVSRKYTVETF